MDKNETRDYRNALAKRLSDMRYVSTRQKTVGYWEGVKENDSQYAEARKAHLSGTHKLQEKLWTKIPAERRFNDEILSVYINYEKNRLTTKEINGLGLLNPHKRASDACYSKYSLEWSIAHPPQLYSETWERVSKENQEMRELVRQKYKNFEFSETQVQTFREIILNGMRALDEAYANGITQNDLLSDVYYSLVETKKLNLEDFDTDSIRKNVVSVQERIGKIFDVFSFAEIKPHVGVNWVRSCGGDHDMCGGLYFPTEFECTHSIDRDGRKDKVIEFLDQFKKTPIQIAQLKRAKLTKARKERSKKEAERYNKFDAAI